jgi:small-conductance mechanosensitive channel
MLGWLAWLLEMWPALLLFAGLCVLATAVHFSTPSNRGRLSRTLPVLAVAVVAGATEIAARQLGYDTAATWLRLVVHLVFAFSAVDLAVTLVFEGALRRAGLEVAPIVVELVLIAGWLGAVAVVLTASGIDLTGLAAASTLVAVILTISLQATLGNVVGGVAIQFDRSIQPGDWLELEDKSQGKVRQVRWRHTVLEKRDGNTILVPNNLLLSMRILVLGRAVNHKGGFRIELPFLTPVTTPPERVIAVVEEALRSSPLPNVSVEPPPECLCVDIGGHHAGFNSFVARIWVEDPMPDQPTASLARVRVHTAMRRAGLAFGVPISSVSFDTSMDRQAGELKEQSRTVLDRVSLFDCLTPAEKDQLAPRLRQLPFGDGEILTREGELADWLYLLASGKVRVWKEGQHVGDLRAPDLFGELGLMTGAPRSATITARGPVMCYRLDKAVFDDVLRARSGIDMALSEILASRRMERTTTPASTDPHPGAHPDEQWWLSRIRGFFRL